MPAFSSHVLQSTCDSPEKYLLQNLPKYWSKTNGSLNTWVLLGRHIIDGTGDVICLPFFKDGLWSPWVLVDVKSGLATLASSLSTLRCIQASICTDQVPEGGYVFASTCVFAFMAWNLTALVERGEKGAEDLCLLVLFVTSWPLLFNSGPLIFVSACC